MVTRDSVVYPPNGAGKVAVLRCVPFRHFSVAARRLAFASARDLCTAKLLRSMNGLSSARNSSAVLGHCAAPPHPERAINAIAAAPLHIAPRPHDLHPFLCLCWALDQHGEFIKCTGSDSR